ncbi:hypothetical protein DIPPA_63357 [Diplonema papillatum]|nr:hypothetical protein DIPPA_63357 [Diplonema papillatum]
MPSSRPVKSAPPPSVAPPINKYVKTPVSMGIGTWPGPRREVTKNGSMQNVSSSKRVQYGTESPKQPTARELSDTFQSPQSDEMARTMSSSRVRQKKSGSRRSQQPLSPTNSQRVLSSTGTTTSRRRRSSSKRKVSGHSRRRSRSRSKSVVLRSGKTRYRSRSRTLPLSAPQSPENGTSDLPKPMYPRKVNPPQPLPSTAPGYDPLQSQPPKIATSSGVSTRHDLTLTRTLSSHRPQCYSTDSGRHPALPSTPPSAPSPPRLTTIFDAYDRAPEDLPPPPDEDDHPFGPYDVVVRGSFVIEGLNFARYEASTHQTSTRSLFTKALRDDVIASVGHGVKRKDIMLRAAPGLIRGLVLEYDQPGDIVSPRVVGADWGIEFEYAIRVRDVNAQHNVGLSMYHALSQEGGLELHASRAAWLQVEPAAKASNIFTVNVEESAIASRPL